MGVIAAFAVLAALGAAFLKGAAAARQKEASKRIRETLENVETRNRIEEEVELLDDTGLAERASRWVRKPPGSGE